MDRLITISFAFLLTALVLACGGGRGGDTVIGRSTDSDAPTQGTVVPTDATATVLSSDPVAILKHSFERINDIEAFRAQISSQIRVETLGLSALQTADVDVAENGRISVSVITDQSEGKRTVFADRSHVYVKVADQRQGWVRMNIEAVGEQPGPGLGAGFRQFLDPLRSITSLFPREEVPWGLYTIQSLGREKVDGNQTEHLSVQMEMQRILQNVGEEKVKQLLPYAASIQTAEVEKLEFWIDGQGYIRRGVLEIAFQTLEFGAAGSVGINMRFFDINEDIRVEVPEDYQDLKLRTGYASQYVDRIGVQHPTMPGSSQTHIREGQSVNYSTTPPTSGSIGLNRQNVASSKKGHQTSGSPTIWNTAISS